MFLATLITNRPHGLQAEQWALRDGEPFRAHVTGTFRVAETAYLDGMVSWLGAEALVVDVLEMERLTELYGSRDRFTILVGIGAGGDELMAEFYRAGYCNAFARVDQFDSRSSLMAILDRIRRGEFRSVEAALVRA